MATSQVRGQLGKHNGYEVEVEEGNFVCAFHTALDSIRFAVAVQSVLVNMAWHPVVLAQPWAAEQRTATNELLFRGLRLSIGMCTGNAARVQACLRTGKIEYYGPIMNHAARVAVAAHGGQILLHESSWNHVMSCRDEEIDGLTMFRNMGKHALKGISRSVYIIQVRSLYITVSQPKASAQ
jgi:adenylate cyclase